MAGIRLVDIRLEGRVAARGLAPDELAREFDWRVEQHDELGPRQRELAVLDLVEPVEKPAACLALELCALVCGVRARVPVADDEVALLERSDDPRPGVESVARIEERRELRVHLIRRPELAVQVVRDGAAERIVVVERKAERGDAVAFRLRRLGEAGRLRPFPGAVDAFDREQDAHGCSISDQSRRGEGMHQAVWTPRRVARPVGLGARRGGRNAPRAGPIRGGIGSLVEHPA